MSFGEINNSIKVLMSGMIEDDSEFIPIITDDEEDEIIGQHDIPDNLPILPLKNTVLFPGVVIPITVGREKSIKLVREVYQRDKIIGVLSQVDNSIIDPKASDLYKIGTLAQIIRILEMPDGSTSVIIQGKKKIEVQEFVEEEPFIRAKVQIVYDERPEKDDKEFDALVDSLRDFSLKIVQMSSNIPPEATFALKNIGNYYFLINFIASNSSVKTGEKQKLLALTNVKERANKLLEFLHKEMQMLELKNDIQTKVKADLDKQQREFLLNQQMKTIQDELGGNPMEKEIEELKLKGKKKKWTAEVQKVFEKETVKLHRMNPATGEYSVQLNYVQTLLDLPWSEYSKDNFDLRRAQKILDDDHFGLEKVKERILEHLAVLKLKGDLKSPILCLYGPPGVGKTSLGKSIARAINRKYVRMSLGGLHDEAEIRGHRKTYIGAMPGRIIQNIKKAKTSNPVFILDEIDKVGRDAHGDPASALLEVLDPEQNSAFYDNYLELEYDLSKVMFIATANTISTIHPALRDRMEMIDVSGYLMEEKIEIAKRHLIPKQLENHGVKKAMVQFKKEILELIVENYTRESGVRELDKKIAKVVRQITKKIAFEEDYNKAITTEDLITYLGQADYIKDKYQGNEFAGVVTGLAWTAHGGEILFVETSLSKGKGRLTITGNLGDVMKESAVLALEYLKSHAQQLDVEDKAFENWNVHLHVPEGAIPKDGPSAGITMMTSLASAFTQRKVKSGVAMTGEITLRGKVLPVGGIKEKILAAKRANIKEIILSEDNKKDISEIKEVYIKGLTFHFVRNVMDVLEIALLKQKVKKPVQIS